MSDLIRISAESKSSVDGVDKQNADTKQNADATATEDTEAVRNFIDDFRKTWDDNYKAFMESKGTANGTQGKVDVDNRSSKVYSKRNETEDRYKKKKTHYDEFGSNVMQWSNSAGTRMGDTKVFCKKAGEFVLLEADGNGGAVELARGNYKKVRNYLERIYNEGSVGGEIGSLYEDSQIVRFEEGRNIRSVFNDEITTNDDIYSRQTGRERLQSNSSGNNEHNRTGDKGKSVKYSKRIIEDDFLSTENRAQPNARSSINWVYKAEIFSVTENKMFHQKISEINQGSEAFEQNADGEYMLPIENKIVFTDGNYDAPYISKIIEVMTDAATEFEDAKERIFDVEKGKSQKQDAARVLENFYGDGFILTYRSGTVGVYAWKNGKRKGRTRSQVIKNYQRKQNRRGNDTEGRGTESVDNDILFSYRSTQTDGRYLAREIKQDYLLFTSKTHIKTALRHNEMSQSCFWWRWR